MDGIDGLKQWECKQGHVLGVIRRVKVEGNGGITYHVSRLMLFRQAVDPRAERPEEVDVIATVEGTTLDVRCSCCGATRTWYIGENALERLVGRG